MSKRGSKRSGSNIRIHLEIKHPEFPFLERLVETVKHPIVVAESQVDQGNGQREHLTLSGELLKPRQGFFGFAASAQQRMTESHMADGEGILVRVTHRHFELLNSLVQSSSQHVHSAKLEAAEQKVRLDFERFP